MRRSTLKLEILYQLFSARKEGWRIERLDSRRGLKGVYLISSARFSEKTLPNSSQIFLRAEQTRVLWC